MVYIITRVLMTAVSTRQSRVGANSQTANIFKVALTIKTPRSVNCAASTVVGKKLFPFHASITRHIVLQSRLLYFLHGI